MRFPSQRLRELCVTHLHTPTYSRLCVTPVRLCPWHGMACMDARPHGRAHGQIMIRVCPKTWQCCAALCRASLFANEVMNAQRFSVNPSSNTTALNFKLNFLQGVSGCMAVCRVPCMRRSLDTTLARPARAPCSGGIYACNEWSSPSCASMHCASTHCAGFCGCAQPHGSADFGGSKYHSHNERACDSGF